jgi:hypothetical protein
LRHRSGRRRGRRVIERAEAWFHLMLLALSVGTIVYVMALGGHW